MSRASVPVIIAVSDEFLQYKEKAELTSCQVVTVLAC